MNSKQRQYLIGADSPRARRFYLLPKIHKDRASWNKSGEIPPGRPIVSDCNSETYFTTEYIEYFLNPISQKHPSYLKDSYDFIEKVGQLQIPPTAFLFTMDVDSLYTNIETKLGLEAIRKWFLKYPDPRRPEKQLLKLLEIHLNRNDFEFNSQFYLQIKGTAMGKKFAPSYANIFMADWEESALEKAPLKPLHYYRLLNVFFKDCILAMHSFSRFKRIFWTASNVSFKSLGYSIFRAKSRPKRIMRAFVKSPRLSMTTSSSSITATLTTVGYAPELVSPPGSPFSWPLCVAQVPQYPVNHNK